MTTLSKKSCLLLKVLVNKYHRDGSSSAFLNVFPMEMAKQIDSETVDSTDAASVFAIPEDRIAKVHYSWLLEPVNEIPEPRRSIFIHSLPPTHRVPIIEALKIPSLKKIDYPPKIKDFLLGQFYKKIDGINEVTPEAYLETEPLTFLLSADRQILLETCDYLGIYDLAVNVRQTVDKSKLKRIVDCLSPPKQKFLKMLLSRQDKIQMPELDLSSWQGNCGQLNKILHKRGLVRLAVALSGHSSDFIWHFTHHLDTGRGKIIQKYYTPEIHPSSSVLTEQVVFIINALTRKGQ